MTSRKLVIEALENLKATDPTGSALNWDAAVLARELWNFDSRVSGMDARDIKIMIEQWRAKQ